MISQFEYTARTYESVSESDAFIKLKIKKEDWQRYKRVLKFDVVRIVLSNGSVFTGLFYTV